MNRHPALVRALAALAMIVVLSTAAPARAVGFLEWLTATEAPAETADTHIELPLLTLAPTDDGAVPFPTPSLTPEPTPDPNHIPEGGEMPLSALTDDGVLRVLLRSLNGPEQLTLTLSGAYTLDGNAGFRFDRDARVLLTAAEGNVYLSAGGLNINLGPSATFTRHSASAGAENGVRIAESEKDTLYCGDLTVSAEGGALRPVLSIGIEDYLYGVVGYEMSDSFPLEALKAQAVAARTYAMQRKRSAGSRDYDVVDTTADQVYKGLDPSYTNVVAAVDATRGVVGVYGGGFAVCYYTASNGGQTALASQIWGGADSDGYLSMTDDPYDVENTRSLQNELTITPSCGGSAKLKAMLEAALAPMMAEAGYGEGEWLFHTIEAIEPVDPRFEGSRMYDGVAFTLRPMVLSRALATPEPTPESDATPSPTPTAGPTGSAHPTLPALSVPALSVPAMSAPAMSAPAMSAPAMSVPALEMDMWAVSEETYTVVLDTYDDIKDGLSLGLNGGDYELISVETSTDEMGALASFTLIMRRFGHGVGMSQRGAQWMAGHYDKNWLEILNFYYPGMSVERIDWPEAALTALEALPEGVGSLRPTATPRPTPAPLPELLPGEYYAVVRLSNAGSTLNVRQSASTSSRVLDTLLNGQRVIVSGAIDGDGWVIIHTAEVAGYVKAEYLARE